MADDSLSICVLTYNGESLINECLASIDRQQIPQETRIEKVIVDNGSFLPVAAPIGWRVHRLEQNRGNIGGQNACFEAATHDWILFVANDVRMTFDFLTDLWRERSEWHHILQPLLMTPRGFVDNHGLRWVWPGYGFSERSVTGFSWGIDAFTSSCYLMHRWIWESLNGFDETLGSSHEDVDFSLRAAQLKIRVKRCYGARAIHLGNATLKHTMVNPRKIFHHARLKVIRKHYRFLNYWTRYLTIQCLDHLPHP